MTSATVLSFEQRAYTSEAWTSTEKVVHYNPFIGEVVAPGSWSIYLSKTFVAALIAEGYKTISMEVSSEALLICN